MTSYDMGSARRVRRGVVVLVVVLLVGTVLASLLSARALGADQRTRFDSQTARLDTALAERMRAYEQVLRGGVGLFESSDDVTRADWSRYVDALRLPERYPGFKSLSFARAVPGDDLDRFVAEVRATNPTTADGQPYSLRAPVGSSGTTDLHGPILYVAPDDPVNRRVLGVDMMLEPARRAAMEKAVETGNAVASPRLRLSGSDNDEAGFIVYVPVVKDDRLLGWLTAAFLAETFTDKLDLARGTNLDLEILDGTGPDAQLLHSTTGVDADGGPLPLVVDDPAFTSTSTVAVPGRDWQVRYVAPDGFVPGGVRLVPWGVLLAGLLLSAVVLLLGRGADRWRRLAGALDRQTGVLTSAREEAEAATLATSTFLATMSHEIRTPLNAVLGANSLLLETPLDADQASYAAMIRDGGHHLLHVVNEVLDLSKAEAGRVVLEEEAFDLGSCVRTVLDLTGAEAGRKAITLGLDLRAPQRVVGDVARLRQVLLNLVGNAVKFTPEAGRVSVSVFTVPPEGADLVAFEVADTGIGIAADHLAELFDPYVQASASTTRTYGGTGLGLSIAHRLVEAMGGTITVDSEVGVGTTFRFTVRLPAALPPGPAPDGPATDDRPTGPTGPTDEGAPAATLRVLVAEDDAMSRELIAHMLDLLGHPAHVVGDGAQAVAAAESVAYDVVFLDRHMPGVDGLQAAHRILALRPEEPRPRIVAISGSVGRDGGFGDLADDVVAKPFVLDDLAAALDRASASPHG